MPGSRGCGANMRAQPTGFIQDPRTRAGYAQLQAALTHGHPTALAAAELTAEAIRQLMDGTPPANLNARLMQHCAEQRLTSHQDWLGDLWNRARTFRDPEEHIGTDWDERRGVLERLGKALKDGVPDLADPCGFTGEGWVAEEALATELLCFLLNSGDSDSITCLTGAFAGVHLGVRSFPEEWQTQIEYSAELQRQRTAGQSHASCDSATTGSLQSHAL